MLWPVPAEQHASVPCPQQLLAYNNCKGELYAYLLLSRLLLGLFGLMAD